MSACASPVSPTWKCLGVYMSRFLLSSCPIPWWPAEPRWVRAAGPSTSSGRGWR